MASAKFKAIEAELDAFALKHSIPDYLVSLHCEQTAVVSGVAATASRVLLFFRRLTSADSASCAAVFPYDWNTSVEEQVTVFVTAASFRQICSFELLW